MQSRTKKVIYCDFKAATAGTTTRTNREDRRRRRSSSRRSIEFRNSSDSCDQNLINNTRPTVISSNQHLHLPLPLQLVLLFILLATPISTTHQTTSNSNNNSSTFAHIQIIDHQHPHPLSHPHAHLRSVGAGPGHAHTLASPHLQPSYVYGPPAGQSASGPANKNRTTNQLFNFTHIAYDELTNSIYVGATNWLFQLSGANLRPEHALKVGPAAAAARADCSNSPPTDQCQTPPIVQVDSGSLPLRHAPGAAPADPGRLRSSSAATDQLLLLQNQLVAAGKSSSGGKNSSATLVSLQQQQQQQPQQHNNNYNKILAIDGESRQLIVCGSLNQGACRKHSLGQLSNFSDLIPLPVASNDESSSSVAFIPRQDRRQQQQQQQRLMYVAATNSRPDPYRDMVPAISARHLEPAQKTMQIIESSFAEARVDISFELRDYYLVNYVYAFQHGDFVYFATVQRRSPLRQLEEWGYITRLARLCLSDLSFQSYTEMTLECVSASSQSGGGGYYAGAGKQHQQTNYNLLQDAQLISAGSELAQQLRLTKSNQVLATVFAQSRDHSTRSQQKSAVCLFPMEMIEQRFNENIQQCYNGTSKSRNMNYIGGSVSDCPRPGVSKSERLGRK